MVGRFYSGIEIAVLWFWMVLVFRFWHRGCRYVGYGGIKYEDKTILGGNKIINIIYNYIKYIR